jgi:hypothetical protein
MNGRLIDKIWKYLNSRYGKYHVIIIDHLHTVGWLGLLYAHSLPDARPQIRLRTATPSWLNDLSWMENNNYSHKGSLFLSDQLSPSTPETTQTLSANRELCWNGTHYFLLEGVILNRVHRRELVCTDVSLADWGAVFRGMTASGRWRPHGVASTSMCWRSGRFAWHSNSSRSMEGKHVLVRSDNAVAAYINHHGGLRSWHLHKMASELLLWA